MSKATEVTSLLESVTQMLNLSIPQSKLKIGDFEKIKTELTRLGVKNLSMVIDGDAKIVKVSGYCKADNFAAVSNFMKKFQ